MSMSQAKPIEKVFMPEPQLQPPGSQGKNIPEPVHARRLSVALQLVGVIFTFGIYPLTLVWPSGWAWHTGYTSHYLQMILGVYATLGIFLLIASRKPLAHLSLIWFTVWSSVVHAGIMAAQALGNPEHRGHLWGDVPALFLVAGVLALLTPRGPMSTLTLAPDIESLKSRLRATWMAGDYGRFSRFMESGAHSFYERLDVPPGAHLLDVACGSGQLALIAAREGVRVTSVDIAETLIERAQTRSTAERLTARFRVADAESLPFPDSSFDMVVSLVGAMFAPRPHLVARELARVCVPGGTIAMANWTAEGFVGKMFRAIAKFIAPSGTPSPLLWGDETVVRERLGPQVQFLSTRRAPVILCHCAFAGGSWKDILEYISVLPCPHRLVVTSETADDFLWAEVLNLGGYDVIAQPLWEPEVARTLSSALRRWEEETTNAGLN